MIINKRKQTGLDSQEKKFAQLQEDLERRKLNYVKEISTPEEYKVFEARAIAFNANCPKEMILDCADADDSNDETNLECEYELINPFAKEGNRKQNEEPQNLLQQIEEKERNLLEMQKQLENMLFSAFRESFVS